MGEFYDSSCYSSPSIYFLPSLALLFFSFCFLLVSGFYVFFILFFVLFKLIISSALAGVFICYFPTPTYFPPFPASLWFLVSGFCVFFLHFLCLLNPLYQVNWTVVSCVTFPPIYFLPFPAFSWFLVSVFYVFFQFFVPY